MAARDWKDVRREAIDSGLLEEQRIANARAAADASPTFVPVDTIEVGIAALPAWGTADRAASLRDLQARATETLGRSVPADEVRTTVDDVLRHTAKEAACPSKTDGHYPYPDAQCAFPRGHGPVVVVDAEDHDYEIWGHGDPTLPEWWR